MYLAAFELKQQWYPSTKVRISKPLSGVYLAVPWSTAANDQFNDGATAVEWPLHLFVDLTRRS
jgi:hypothetical protein